MQVAGPLPWIGMYVAAASLVCTLAMAADLFGGYYHKRRWFPCKFFTLNAASLTLMAIVVKLPLDLSSSMKGNVDQLAKLSSNAFVCIMMGSFIPSLGSMDDKEISMNVIALGILVITITVNICIQISTSVVSRRLWKEQIIVLVSMLLLFLTLGFSGLIVPTRKRYFESKCEEIHKLHPEQELKQTRKITTAKLKEIVKQNWTVVESGSPQFMISRSVACVFSGAICMLVALTLPEAFIRIRLEFHAPMDQDSDYEWSTVWILVVQSIGVLIGAAIPIFRWFNTVRFENMKEKSNIWKNVLKVENYWTQRLVGWRKRVPPLPGVRDRSCREFIQDIKHFILTLGICVQGVIVIAGKLILLLSIFAVTLYNCCCCNMSDNKGESEPREQDLRSCVVPLEGEDEFPPIVLNNIQQAADRFFKKSGGRQPKKLTELLKKFRDFYGVLNFENDQVQNLYPEAPNSWSLPVVTLTSIAIAIPLIGAKCEKLIDSVGEGLSYAWLVESQFYNKGERKSTKNIEDLWGKVELEKMWLDLNLEDMATTEKSTEKILQNLASRAEEIVNEIKAGSSQPLPITKKSKIIAANSMYRITNTLLLNHEEEHGNENLFEQISVIIASILAACLTNLPHVIIGKCFSCCIEKMEESVTTAARLVGETEEILNLVQGWETPALDIDKMAFINEWRTSMKQTNASVSESKNVNQASTSNLDSKNVKQANTASVSKSKVELQGDESSVLKSKNVKKGGGSDSESKNVTQANASVSESKSVKQSNASDSESKSVKQSNASDSESKSVKQVNASVSKSEHVKQAGESNSDSKKQAKASVSKSKYAVQKDESTVSKSENVKQGGASESKFKNVKQANAASVSKSKNVVQEDKSLVSKSKNVKQGGASDSKSKNVKQANPTDTCSSSSDQLTIRIEKL